VRTEFSHPTRVHAPARAYLERKQKKGKSRHEAIRCLKRQLARTVYGSDTGRGTAHRGGRSLARLSAFVRVAVRRTSGLGPAPRRIGPTWSEFLRAQAQSMLGDNLGSGIGDTFSRALRPSRTGRAKSRRSERWKPTTAELRLLLPSHAWPVSSSQYGAALRRRRSSAFSLPLADRRAYRHHKDRVLATDRQEQLVLCPAAEQARR
jgi:hypothetical protein